MKLKTFALSLFLFLAGLEAHAFRYYLNHHNHETSIMDKDSAAIYTIAEKNKGAKFNIRIFTSKTKVKGPAMQERYALVRAINIRKVIMSAGVPLQNIEIIVKRGNKKTSRVMVDVIK